jgi:hypothetical protein
VRITLDTELTLGDETRAKKVGQWCVDAQSQREVRPQFRFYASPQNVQLSLQLVTPFAVLEVKLKDGRPPWVDYLLEEVGA